MALLVSFRLSETNRGKIKNNKILMCHLQLSPFLYEIRYTPENEIVVPDALKSFCRDRSPKRFVIAS